MALIILPSEMLHLDSDRSTVRCLSGLSASRRECVEVVEALGGLVMDRGLFSRIGFAVMAVLAVFVAILSSRYYGVVADHWLDIDPGIRSVIVAHPVAALGHMLVAPVALLLGPLQFMRRLRARHPALHRWAGRAYVAACMVGGLAGFATAFHASGGPVAGLGFGLLAIPWVGVTLVAWRAAVVRNIALHRICMRFSYAMTFGAVSLRLQIPIGYAIGFTSYSAMSVWLAYTAWVPNIIVVGLYSLRRGSWHGTPAASA